MPVRDQYDHGTPSWVDLNTTDPQAAKAFYAALFGWTVDDMPLPDGGVYSMLKLDGRDAAALSGMAPAQDGVPPHWNTYITVDDVDAAAAKVAELGGSVHVPPFDVMDAGRMAVLQDPTGAFVCLWTAKEHIGAGVVGQPGALIWSELFTTDVDRAGAFYARLLGWQPTVHPDHPGYTMFMNGEQGVAGMVAITEEMGPMPPSWLSYFGVADCDAVASKAVELGAALVMPPTDFPKVGRGATLRDPQGAVFAVVQMLQWPEE